MPDFRELDGLLAQRPILVVVAGPNGSGKSTFFQAHLAGAGLRFVNADLLARELAMEAQQAAAAADALRAELIRQRESFVTETVFSDPVGAKLRLFTQAMVQGYAVILLYIGVSGPERCDERVAMRVSQGGHDVPLDRLIARFPRSLANLRAALPVLSAVLVYDNDDLLRPYRLVARVMGGQVEQMAGDPPAWWTTVVA
jgi:predicted ABC-type ATPase